MGFQNTAVLKTYSAIDPNFFKTQRMLLHATTAEKLPANVTAAADTLARRTTASAAATRLRGVSWVQPAGSGMQVQDVSQADYSG
jgi:hypothetical protein